MGHVERSQVAFDPKLVQHLDQQLDVNLASAGNLRGGYDLVGRKTISGIDACLIISIDGPTLKLIVDYYNKAMEQCGKST